MKIYSNVSSGLYHIFKINVLMKLKGRSGRIYCLEWRLLQINSPA